MQMGAPDSREYCSRIFGSYEEKNVTRQVNVGKFFKNQQTGLGTEGTKERFFLYPEQIRRLDSGEGYVLTHNPYRLNFVKFSGDKYSGLSKFELKKRLE